MNIFIYGSKSFKKEIHNVLDHANIKFKLDEDSIIKDINSLIELKSTIEESPHDIYLIEEEKIIKRNSLNSKVKFLTPKDGIDEDFLLEHSIPDITIDSLDDLPNYILKKQDEYLAEKEDFDVENEIIGIVDDAYLNNDEEDLIDEELSDLLVKDKDNEINQEDDVIDDFTDDGFDEYKFEENIDDKLLNIEDQDEVQIVDFDKELENIEDLMDNDQNEIDFSKVEDNDINIDELESILEEKSVDEPSEEIEDQNVQLDSLVSDEQEPEIDEDDLDSLLNELDETMENSPTQEEELNFDELNKELDNDDSFLEELEEFGYGIEDKDDKIEDIESSKEKNNISKIKDETVGEDDMNDDFSELDSISEEELLEVLNETSTATPIKGLESNQNNSEISSKKSDHTMEVSSSSIEDLTKIFAQLLNNKTIEITIKIKD